jgi:hypothetical protein
LSSDDEPTPPPPASGLSQTSSGPRHHHHQILSPLTTPPRLHPVPPGSPLQAASASPARSKLPRPPWRRHGDRFARSLASSGPKTLVSVRSPRALAPPASGPLCPLRFGCSCLAGRSRDDFVSDFASAAWVRALVGGVSRCISVRFDPPRAVVCVCAAAGSGFSVIVAVELRSSLAVVGVRVDWVRICDRWVRILCGFANASIGASSC